MYSAIEAFSSCVLGRSRKKNDLDESPRNGSLQTLVSGTYVPKVFGNISNIYGQ